MINLRDPYDVYRLYVGLKLHFTNQKYDWMASRGHVSNSTKHAFQKRNDKNFFKLVKKKFQEPRWIYEYFLANFSHDPEWWIGESERGVAIYNDWKSVISNLGSTISTDIEFLTQETYNSGISFYDSVRISEDDPHPMFAQWVLGGQISFETATVLSNGLPILSLWRKMAPEVVKRDLVIKPLALRLQKYATFFEVRDHIDAHAHELKELYSNTSRIG